MKKKILSIGLLLALVVSLIPPMTALAEDAQTELVPVAQPTQEEIVYPVEEPQFATYSGSCGDNVKWSLDTNAGILTIRGKGEMKDYSDPWSNYISSIKTVIIENGVTSIGSWAFSDCSKLTSVNIPDSVTSIGSRAFYRCSNLTNLTIGNGAMSIGDEAFRYCSSLTTVTIPDSVTSIDYYAFSNCTSLKNVTIGNGVMSIGVAAFSNCGSLTSATIGYGVTSIGYHVFHDSNSITSITVSPYNSVYDSRNNCNAIIETATNTLIYGCKDTVIPNSVTSIGNDAFYDCDSLATISIPDSVTSIGDYAFYACGNLASVTIPDSVTSIGKDAFFCCSSLTSITIPDSVTSIGDSAFSGCTSLSSVTIPDSVTSIRDSSFSSCTKLTSVNILNSVTSIGDSAFSGCTSLSSVTIPDSVTSIGRYAFKRCANLKDVYYSGTRKQWARITIGSYNDPLQNATIHFQGERGSKNDAQSYTITPMDFGALCINAHGAATAYYRVLDENGNYLPSLRISYSLDGQTSTVTTDANGIFAVRTPSISETTNFTATFFAPDGKPVQNNQSTFQVTVKPFSYTQSWDTAGSFGAELKASGGASAAAGVEAEATAIKVFAKNTKKTKTTIEDSYENGVRTLEVSIANTSGLSSGIKSGIDAKLPKNLTLDVISAQASASKASTREYGYKVVGYDENNMQHVASLGGFYLLSSLAGSGSVFKQCLVGHIQDAVCNTGKVSSAVAVSASTGILGLTHKKETAEQTTSESIQLAGVGAEMVVKTSESFDKIENTKKIATSMETKAGYGFGKGLKRTVTSGDIESGSSFGDYVYGVDHSNYKEISAKYDASTNAPQSLSYKAYSDAKKSIFFGGATNNTYATVTYRDEALQNILKNNATVAGFVAQTDGLVNPQKAIEAMSSSGEQASVTQTVSVGTGFDYDIPLGLTVFAGGEVDFGLSGAHELSYNDASGVIYGDIQYKTSQSDITRSEAEGRFTSVSAILNPAISCVWDTVKDSVYSVANTVKKGVSNGYAVVKNGVSSAYVKVSKLADEIRGSYAVYSLEYIDMPMENVSVSATVGEPYVVEFYKDESATTLLTDEELAANPMSLTLEYTFDMLSLAGAPNNADVVILRYDSERAVYIVEQSSVQDKENKTVTAQITHNGEYILAVDSVAPCVSDFTVSDETATPEISALVSDLSGVSSLRFWIDDGADLVTAANLSKYYNPTTDVFTYRMTEPLAPGEHTAHFFVADALGNASAEQIDFAFTVSQMQGEIASITCSSDFISGYEDVTITATASEENTFASMVLRYTVNGNTFSTKMEQNGTEWTADVTPIYGAASMEFVAVASDGKGNTVQSEPLVVGTRLQNPLHVTMEKVSGVSNGSGKDYMVKVTNTGNIVSAAIIVSSYDANGKLLETKMEPCALKTNETETVSISTRTNAASVRAFAIDGRTLIPLTEALTLEG